MIEPRRRNAQISALMEAYGNIMAELANSNQPTLISLAVSWENTRRQINEILTSQKPSVRLSSLAEGLKQGLRDLPRIFRDLPQSIRKPLMENYRHTIEVRIPGFFKNESARIDRIIARGRIRTQSEWYSIRYLIDNLESDPLRQQELLRLNQIVDSYKAC